MIEELQAEHRTLEALLEALPESWPAARDAVLAHYARERSYLDRVRAHSPAVAAKLTAQHDEVEEIARELDRSLAAGHRDDVAYLTRRFRALAQHNIIEEERDVFPLRYDQEV